MQRLILFLACWALTVMAQDAAAACDCSAAEAQAKKAKAEAAALKEQLAKAQGQVKQLQADLDTSKSSLRASKDQLKRLKDDVEANSMKEHSEQGAELSVLVPVTKTCSIAGDVIQHLLQQTNIDDQVMDTVSGHVGAAKDFTVDVVGQLAAVDYNEYVKNLTKHELYVLHVAPAMDKVAEGAQPYVDLYFSPALKSAQVYTDPAMETAKVTYASVARAVEGDVLPALKRSSSQALTEIPRIWSLGVARLDVFVQPIFDVIARAAPKHSKGLPKSTLDRVLILCVLLVSTYYGLRVCSVFLRIALKIVLRVLRVVFGLLVRLPLLLVRVALGYSLWFATGFYCCGLCRRRRQAATNGDAKTNDAAKKPTGPPQKAELNDLVQLLEGSKKKNKVEPAVKLLTELAASGKPMASKNFPAGVQGKLVDKATLDKALAKIGHKK